MNIINILQITTSPNIGEGDQFTKISDYHSRDKNFPNSADMPPQGTERTNIGNIPKTMMKREI